jgi:hypothetical protein
MPNSAEISHAEKEEKLKEMKLKNAKLLAEVIKIFINDFGLLTTKIITVLLFLINVGWIGSNFINKSNHKQIAKIEMPRLKFNGRSEKASLYNILPEESGEIAKNLIKKEENVIDTGNIGGIIINLGFLGFMIYLMMKNKKKKKVKEVNTNASSIVDSNKDEHKSSNVSQRLY